jgi:hypothetical protein
MSFINESFNIGKKNMIVGNGKEDFDISSINGYEVKINGIVPSAGGGGGVPPVGDIDFIGNLNCNDQPGGGSKGIISAEKKVVSGLGGIETSGNIEITSNGNLTLNGNGSILQLGSGSITSGSGGIESTGDIKTIGSFDLEIGKDIYFDGTDIYHRTNNPVAQKSYKDYKQLPGLNDANKFTGANEFNSNTTEFSAKVSVGTRDPQSLLFTQNLALNTSGNIESKTINNGTIIQCGTINCGNAGENEVRARQFNTRTNEHSSPDGWVIEQGLPHLFKDSSNSDILLVKNTEIQLGTNISIKFGNYSFRPIEITYAFTGATVSDAPGTLFNSLTTSFTRTNDGDTNVKLNDLGEGIYILSIDAGSSSGLPIPRK